jgi:serine/threonine protein kinase
MVVQGTDQVMNMTPTRWQEIKAVFVHALEQVDNERTTFLDLICQDDYELRKEVEILLAAAARVGDFLETPLLSPFTELMSSPTPQRVGRYRLLREIGHGGMGTVYLAEPDCENDGHQVAIKLMRKGMNKIEAFQSFYSERQVLAHLEHESIVKAFDDGTTEEGLPYFVMEYIDGLPLDEYCDNNSLSVRRRLEIFQRVCSAVHFAHSKQVIHRDLKPSNILVAETDAPKLIDFGIAKRLGRDCKEEHLAKSLRALTPAYASPNQIQGKVVTIDDDIYSLGVLLYQLLTGKSPHALITNHSANSAQAVCEEGPTSLRRLSRVIGRLKKIRAACLRRPLAGNLERIALIAMQKDSKYRYESVKQLERDIECHLKHTPALAEGSTRYMSRQDSCMIESYSRLHSSC